MTPNRYLAHLFPAVLCAFLALAAPGAALAQTQTLYWERFDVDITVLPNGDTQVVETQAINFVQGTFRRGFAVIPTTNTEGIGDVSVSADGQVFEESQSERPFTYYLAQESNGDLGVYWFFPETGPGLRTFELAYTVQGGLRIADDGDKLQWKAIPYDRSAPVDAATVTVHLPPGAEVTEAAVTYSPVPVDWQTSTDGRTVTFVAAETVPAYEELEIGVVFTHGIVSALPPAWQAEEDRRVAWESTYKPTLDLVFGALGVLLLLGAPVLALVLWSTFGRDPDPGPVPEFISEPPSDLPPGGAGTLLDEQADMPDVVATLVDLGRRGAIEIEEQGLSGAFGTTYNEFMLRKKDVPAGLRPYERKLLDAIFGETVTEQRMSGLRQHFYRHVPGLQDALYEEAVRDGFFRSSPEAVRSRYATAGGVLLVFSAILGALAAFGLAGYITTVLCPFAGLAGVGAALLAVSSRMPAKTRKGVEEAAKWRAFKRYLETIERQTDLKAAADLFDRYLPYAVAFGIDRSWVSKFARVETVPVPGWYRPYPRPMHHGGMPASGLAGAPVNMPSLQGASESMAGGLQSMSDGLVSMLNTSGRVLGSPPPSASAGGGGSGHYGGHRSGGYRGGSFRVGGGGGGGRRGFG